jgi:hypothetical protein
MLGRAAVAAAAVAPAAAPGFAMLPGWVIDFCIGAAAPGAVLVAGGAEYVFEPRLPTLPPLPGRASAREANRPTAATPAITAVATEKRRVIETSRVHVLSDPVMRAPADAT